MWHLEDWSPETGRAWTQGLIDRRGLMDSQTTKHQPSGVMTWTATTYAHVCFDRHRDLGQRIHFISMAALRWKVVVFTAAGVRPIYGASAGVSTKDTGAGFQWKPYIDGIPLKPYDGNERDISVRAEEAVFRYLTSIGKPVAKTSLEENRSGCDLKLLDGSDSFEVKSRDGAFDYLFVQISETNPDKRYI